MSTLAEGFIQKIGMAVIDLNGELGEYITTKPIGGFRFETVKVFDDNVYCTGDHLIEPPLRE